MAARDELPPADFARECGTLLSKIPGVFSVNVSLNAQHELSGIHVLASIDRNAKQISRDVQSAVAAAYQIEIDHRIVSIAQIDGSGCPGIAPRDPSSEVRLRYVGMTMSMCNGKRAYQVRLARGDSEHVGEAECANAPRLKRRAVAEATIRALESALGLQGRLALVTVRNTDVEGIPVVMVAVECPEARDGRLLIGAAHCARDDDETECVVRSTLDALNRFCGRLAVCDRIQS